MLWLLILLIVVCVIFYGGSRSGAYDLGAPSIVGLLLVLVVLYLIFHFLFGLV